MNKKIFKEVDEVTGEIIRGESNINRTTKLYKKLLKEVERLKKRKQTEYNKKLINIIEKLTKSMKVYIDVSQIIK